MIFPPHFKFVLSNERLDLYGSSKKYQKGADIFGHDWHTYTYIYTQYIVC